MATADASKQAPRPLFPRLSGGPGKLAPAEVARHQRARLEGAMVEAVARHGYAGTTLRELVALAGVSKSTFYEHFESKQDCFFATFEEIIEIASRRVGDAYMQPGSIRERLEAGLSALFQLAVDEPAAAYLATVESLTLGSAGVGPREKAWATFERMIRHTFDNSPAKAEVGERTVRAIVAGNSGILFRHLRAGRQEELPGLVGEIADWTLGYEREENDAVLRAKAAAAEEPPPPAQEPVDLTDGALPWDEPPDSRRSRSVLTQRERIIRAAARVVYERGYEALSVPVISGAAGVSNQTFYQNFPSKRDAFLAAFDVLVKRAFEASVRPVRNEDPGPEAVGKVMRAYLEHTRDNPLFARLAYFEVASVGPAAFERGDATIDRFTSLLERTAPAFGGKPPTPNVLVGIGSGLWSVIQYELQHERAEALPELAPELTAIATLPLS